VASAAGTFLKKKKERERRRRRRRERETAPQTPILFIVLKATEESCDLFDSVFEMGTKRLELRALCFSSYQLASSTRDNRDQVNCREQHGLVERDPMFKCTGVV
jgi:hypothetical protein